MSEAGSPELDHNQSNYRNMSLSSRLGSPPQYKVTLQIFVLNHHVLFLASSHKLN